MLADDAIRTAKHNTMEGFFCLLFAFFFRFTMTLPTTIIVIIIAVDMIKFYLFYNKTKMFWSQIPFGNDTPAAKLTLETCSVEENYHFHADITGNSILCRLTSCLRLCGLALIYDAHLYFWLHLSWSSLMLNEDDGYHGHDAGTS